MGKKDLWQCDYFDDKGRFADMFNGVMFQGNPVMKEEELEEADSKLVHHEESGEAVSVIRDKGYKWKGQHVSICILENQSYVDYRMVFRVMLEESVSYIKQQKKVFKKWKESGYKFAGDEFLSQMRKEEKFMPVITLILYLGKEKAWDGAKTLYELLRINEELKPFVTNYRVNLFDYHDEQDFSRFRTDNRFLFELLSNSEDEIKTEEIIKNYLNDYSLDEEVVQAVFGILDKKEDIEKYKKKAEKGDVVSMWKAWDDHKERGRKEALKESLVVLINSLKKFSADLEVIYNAVIENELYKDVTREQVREYFYEK